MANQRWESGAVAVAQVQTFAFAGTWEATDLTRIAVGNKIVDVVAGGITGTIAADAVEAAIAAMSADDYPEIVGDQTGVAAVAVTGTLTLTANSPGTPFTFTLTPLETGGGGADAQTIEGAGTATTGTTATASAGPNDWGTAANWSTGSVPVDTDVIYIDHNSDSVLYGLNQSGIQPTAMYVELSFTGVIGLPKTNSLGTPYPEYLDDYLRIGPATLIVGQGQGSGSGRVKIDCGTDQCAVTAVATGGALEPDLGAFIWKGTHAANTFTALGNADVGIAVYGGEVATIATLTVDGNAVVRCGAGCTLAVVVAKGGTLYINSAVTTSITVYDGAEVIIEGTGNIAQLTIEGGNVVYNGTGTLGGATVVRGNGRLDFSQNPLPKTVTNPIDLQGNGEVIDPDKVVSALIVDYNGREAIAGLGSNARWTRGSVA